MAFVDSALRELAQLVEESGLRLPDAAAARIDQEFLELHLAHPEPAAPDPWIASPDGSVWSVSVTHVPRSSGRISPYPAMVTLGEDPEGGTWLLDLESAGVIQIVGDRPAGTDLARFIAAELALNPWSDAEVVSVVGVGEEIVPLNYGRLFADPRLDIDRLTKLTRQMADAFESSGRDVLASRVPEGEDASVPSVAIGIVGDQDLDASRHAIADLINEMERTPGSNVGGPVGGRLRAGRVPGADAPHHRGGEPRDTVGDRAPEPTDRRQRPPTLGELFDDAETEGDEPIPVAPGPDGEPSNMDEAGALVDELTNSRCGTGDPHSVLPRPDRAYIDAAATTADDLAAFAPEVPPSEVTSDLCGGPDTRG